MMNPRILLTHARAAMGRAKAPYSGFHVGCVVECESGEIFHAGNIEADNSAASICAERAALSRAIAETDSPPIALAIMADAPVTSCGTCRQFMLEFTNLKVYTLNEVGKVQTRTARQLLPKPYTRRRK